MRLTIIILIYASLALGSAYASKNASAVAPRGTEAISEFISLRVRPPELRNILCGIYLFPGSLISGAQLHVFPDGTVMVAYFSDISSPRLIATGNWNLVDETLKITWTDLKDNEVFKHPMLPRQIGEAHELVMFFRAAPDRKSTVYFLASKSADAMTNSKLLTQFARYYDWQKIKSGFMEEK